MDDFDHYISEYGTHSISSSKREGGSIAFSGVIFMHYGRVQVIAHILSFFTRIDRSGIELHVPSLGYVADWLRLVLCLRTPAVEGLLSAFLKSTYFQGPCIRRRRCPLFFLIDQYVPARAVMTEDGNGTHLCRLVCLFLFSQQMYTSSPMHLLIICVNFVFSSSVRLHRVLP